MAVDLVHDLWQELKRYIPTVDRQEAADVLVNLLVDNDYSAEEIRDEFKGDTCVKQSLQSYLSDSEDESEEEDDIDEYDY